MSDKRQTATVAEAASLGQRAPGGKTERLRMRAAWMYYVEQMTQNDIAEALGIGRVTVVRLLAEARARNEVKISVTGGLAELTGLERRLEARFGLARAVIAPLSDPEADPGPPISAALGAFLSEAVQPGMAVGLGWGRTLLQSLPFIEGRALDDLSVISLLGGITEARRFNPPEFVWRFAQIFGGDAFLLTAPAVVASAETKRALIARGGLPRVFDRADALDMVVVSVGALSETATTHRVGFVTAAERRSLAEAGAVGDLLFHFFDRAGVLVRHPLNERVMSVEIDQMRRAGVRVLASGGRDKTDVLIGAFRLLAPTIFITDEATAHRILA